MDLKRRIALAIRNYEGLESYGVSEGLFRGTGHLASPNRLAYALGWIVASEVVGKLYREFGIDVLPSYDRTYGWDRFLLTRRVSCKWCKDEPANSFGQILIRGATFPSLLIGANDVPTPLAEQLCNDPDRAIVFILNALKPPGLSSGDHSECLHRRASIYPVLYDIVTELILEHPGLIAARELFVDDQKIDGDYHPLYLHGIATNPRVVYDWFEIETDEHKVFLRIRGDQVIYRTDRGTWSTVARSLAFQERDAVKRRVLAWLRIAGKPDSITID